MSDVRCNSIYNPVSVNSEAVETLGAVALGIYTYLCYHKHGDYKIYKTKVQKHFSDIGRDRFIKGWEELVENGWITSNQIKSDNGRFGSWEHTLIISRVAKPKNTYQKGNVYLMKNMRNGYTKIGYTKNKPEHRERTLQSEEPEISLMASYSGTFEDESAIHTAFSEKRVRGEWFDLDNNDLSEIEEYFRKAQ